jgi:hypothetical protein
LSTEIQIFSLTSGEGCTSSTNVSSWSAGRIP